MGLGKPTHQLGGSSSSTHGALPELDEHRLSCAIPGEAAQSSSAAKTSSLPGPFMTRPFTVRLSIASVPKENCATAGGARLSGDWEVAGELNRGAVKTVDN